ncbi:hypothetical protein BHE74_00054137 [Ensete ventricosum]|nr:hypothetical protein BHE74_00054137 [Ensete ventricosum]
MQGRPRTASPQGRQPPTARCPQRGRLQGDARKWRPPAASPQGAAHGMPARGAAARGQPCRLFRGSDGVEGDKERAKASF